jgi:tetratricopeptide (TPR) repeat protein
LFGTHASPYHLVNIALHVSNCFLIGLVMRRLQLPGAWLGAALFGVHPVLVESAAWISETKNTLSMFFTLASMLAFFAFEERRLTRYYALSLGLFLLALLSKVVAVALPGALLVILWWQRRLSWRRHVLATLPFVVMAVLYGLLIMRIEWYDMGAHGADFALSLPERTIMAGRAFWFYVAKLIWPAGLNMFYPRWSFDLARVAQYAYPATAIGVFALLWLCRRHARGALATALLFAGCLFPVLGFLNVNYFKFSFVADHLQYIAAPAAIVPASALLARLRVHLPAIPGFLLTTVLLGPLALIAHTHCRDFRNAQSLYLISLARNPDSWVAQNNLATAWLDAGQPGRAIDYARNALRLRPNYPEAHQNLGTALMQQGSIGEAEAHFVESLRLLPENPAALLNLGNICADSGRTSEAIKHFEQALRLDPKFPDAEFNLANLLARTGHPELAEPHFRAALKLTPNSADVHCNFGNALELAGQTADAIAEYEQALRLAPDFVAAHFNLANLLLRQGRTPEAIGHFSRSVELAPEMPEGHCHLGVALFQAGRLAEARHALERALQLRPAYSLARRQLDEIGRRITP